MALVFAIALAGCGGGGGVSVGGGNNSITGVARLLLTDAPACGYQNVFITVDHMEVSPDGNTWTTVSVYPTIKQPIDLLSLNNGILFPLGEIPLPMGTYNQIRLVLAANGAYAPWANYAVPTSNPLTQVPLTTPSAQQSGFKINGPFAVQANSISDLILDFNACKSIVVAGKSGKYLLKPVVVATSRLASGSISGTTTPGSSIYAEQQSAAGPVVINSAMADSTTGTFTLYPIQDSGTGGLVDVVIVPPAPVSGSSGYATDIVQDVPVTAGGDTKLGTITPAAAIINYVNGTVTVTGVAGAANLDASQTVSGTARTYEIASTSTTTGPYSMPLQATGPWIGTYGPSLPITFAQETSPGTIGIFSITATDAAGSVQTQTANISAGYATVNFSLNP